MRVRLVALALAAGLAGCSQAGTGTPADLPEGLALAELEAPCRPLYAIAALDPVRDKLALDGPPTAAALSDAATPDARERDALEAFAKRRADCIARTVATLRASRPQRLPAYHAATARRSLTYARLYSGNVSYGGALYEMAEIDRLYRRDTAALER